MTRKASIHFQPVTNPSFSVSHSERTDLSEPAYLLPKEHQLGNQIVSGSLPEIDIALIFARAKDAMTGQAKARGSSPFWEGVVVLSNTNSQEQSEHLQGWKNAYEKVTGHKVLHMSVHLDEGYMDTDGKPQYNPHAHVIVNRMDSKNRIISLDRKQLAAVQDLTAETLQMERGSTLAERQGKRGRKHVPHREFRTQADTTRLELDGVKAVNTKELDRVKASRDRFQKLFAADTPLINKLKEDIQTAESEVSKKAARIARLTELKEGYKLDRAKLKASGIATQKQYQALKIKHEADLAKIAQLENRVSELTGYTGKLEAAMVAAGERSQVLTDKLEAKTKEHDAFKAQLAAHAAHLIDTTGVAADPAPRTSQSNPLTPDPVVPLGPNARAKLRAEKMALEAPRAAVEPPKATESPLAPPRPEKTPREAFLAVWAGIKMVTLNMIDGARLDAADGRLGLFSWLNRATGDRNQVLCEVPFNKVMPKIGEVFDSRAVPGKEKGGVGR